MILAAPLAAGVSALVLQANPNLGWRDITHAARGSIEVDLTSPGGTVSRLATQRVLDTSADLAWTFSTVRNWGESAAGAWTLTVRDRAVGTTGTLNSVTPSLFGSSPTSTSAPALTSATTASGDVGSAFGCQITVTNAPASYGATGLPAGLSVNALTGFISGKVATAGTYPFTVTATNAFGTGSRSVTLTLATNLAANLADALDQPSLAWSLDLSKPWTRVAGAAPTTHDGVDAARSATIGDNGSTGFSLIASGPQVIRFWWKVSSEVCFDFSPLRSRWNRAGGDQRHRRLAVAGLHHPCGIASPELDV